MGKVLTDQYEEVLHAPETKRHISLCLLVTALQVSKFDLE